MRRFGSKLGDHKGENYDRFIFMIPIFSKIKSIGVNHFEPCPQKMDGLGFVFMTTWRSCVCMRHSKEQTCFERTIMSCWCREHGIFQHQMTTILLMEEILHRLRLVVYPIICKVIYIYIHPGWVFVISSNQRYMFAGLTTWTSRVTSCRWVL